MIPTMSTRLDFTYFLSLFLTSFSRRVKLFIYVSLFPFITHFPSCVSCLSLLISLLISVTFYRCVSLSEKFAPDASVLVWTFVRHSCSHLLKFLHSYLMQSMIYILLRLCIYHAPGRDKNLFIGKFDS